MYPYWSPMPQYQYQGNHMRQQPPNYGSFQSQQQFPSMWQQQGQGNGQFMSQNFPPFPNNFYNGVQNMNYSYNPPNTTHMFSHSNQYSSGQHPSKSVHFERQEGNNKVSYERNGNQEQYASYPQDAVYRRASGPGWQRQETYYPARPFQ